MELCCSPAEITVSNRVSHSTTQVDPQGLHRRRPVVAVFRCFLLCACDVRTCSLAFGSSLYKWASESDDDDR
eukprot:749883-Hanusia_phi.AAC.4